jgi:hypothetical protein
MANLLCSPVLNQINAASGNPPVSRRHRDLVLVHPPSRMASKWVRPVTALPTGGTTRHPPPQWPFRNPAATASLGLAAILMIFQPWSVRIQVMLTRIGIFCIAATGVCACGAIIMSA